jgi:hypothetical protein
MDVGIKTPGHRYNNLAEGRFILKRWVHTERIHTWQARQSIKARSLREMHNERAYWSWSSKARLRCPEVVKSSRLVRIFQDSRRWSCLIRCIRMYCILLSSWPIRVQKMVMVNKVEVESTNYSPKG